MESSPKPLRNLSRNKPPYTGCSERANPALARAIAMLVTTGSLLAPVDTFNKRIVSLKDLPLLPNIKDRERAFNIGNLSVSYPLRFLFLALKERKRQRRQPAEELLHITVNLSGAASRKLLASRKGPVGAYANKLKERMKLLSVKPDYFFIMEKSEDKTLHTHFIMVLPSGQEDLIKKILLKDTNRRPNSVKLDKEYKNYLIIKPDTDEWNLHQIDLEMGESQYPYLETAGRFSGHYYGMKMVDIGLADYLSKDLMKRSLLGYTGRTWYAPHNITEAANNLYEEAYKLQRESVDCHQAEPLPTVRNSEVLEILGVALCIAS